MPTQRRQRIQIDSGSGEEFSDLHPTVDSDDDESVAQTLDNWIFPVVPPKARREEYETASKFHCKFLLTRSDIIFRLLKARKSRLANFKIKSKICCSRILNYVQFSKGKTKLQVPVMFCQTTTNLSRSMPESLE